MSYYGISIYIQVHSAAWGLRDHRAPDISIYIQVHSAAWGLGDHRAPDIYLYISRYIVQLGSVLREDKVSDTGSPRHTPPTFPHVYSSSPTPPLHPHMDSTPGTHFDTRALCYPPGTAPLTSRTVSGGPSATSSRVISSRSTPLVSSNNYSPQIASSPPSPWKPWPPMKTNTPSSCPS